MTAMRERDPVQNGLAALLYMKLYLNYILNISLFKKNQIFILS